MVDLGYVILMLTTHILVVLWFTSFDILYFIF